MRLNLEQIKSIANGVVRVEEKENAFALHRFTLKQQELYKNVSEDFYEKSFCNSGVNLRFKTDSKNLKLEVLLEMFCSRSYLTIEVLVDGKVFATLKNYNESEMVGAYSKKELNFEKNNVIDCVLGDGIKEVEIVLPWNYNCLIKGLYLDDGAMVERVKSKKTWLFYGDSITQGYDCISPSNRYAYRVCKHFKVEEINKAIGGEISRSGLATLKDDLDPEVIIIAYGTNDWSKGVLKEDFYREYLGFLTNIKNNYPTAKIFSITPIWRSIWQEEKPLGKFELVAKLIKKATEEVGDINCIYGFDLVPHDPKFFGDLVLHPSDEGFKHYANNLIAEIEKYL